MDPICGASSAVDPIRGTIINPHTLSLDPIQDIPKVRITPAALDALHDPLENSQKTLLQHNIKTLLEDTPQLLVLDFDGLLAPQNIEYPRLNLKNAHFDKEIARQTLAFLEGLHQEIGRRHLETKIILASEGHRDNYDLLIEILSSLLQGPSDHTEKTTEEAKSHLNGLFSDTYFNGSDQIRQGMETHTQLMGKYSFVLPIAEEIELQCATKTPMIVTFLDDSKENFENFLEMEKEKWQFYHGQTTTIDGVKQWHPATTIIKKIDAVDKKHIDVLPDIKNSKIAQRRSRQSSPDIAPSITSVTTSSPISSPRDRIGSKDTATSTTSDTQSLYF